MANIIIIIIIGGERSTPAENSHGRPSLHSSTEEIRGDAITAAAATATVVAAAAITVAAATTTATTTTHHIHDTGNTCPQVHASHGVWRVLIDW
jgi:hypothetical protein